jgi:hypothetical protein
MKDKNNLQKKTFIEQNSLLQNLFGNELLKFKFTIEDDDIVIFENEKFLEVMGVLQNNKSLKFETLIDIVAVDYSDYEIS